MIRYKIRITKKIQYQIGISSGNFNIERINLIKRFGVHITRVGILLQILIPLHPKHFLPYSVFGTGYHGRERNEFEASI